eukprot:4279441-Pyramimonas_sp.AAC.1
MELIAALAYIWGDYGLPPKQAAFVIHAAIVMHYFDGSYYPKGGPNEIVKVRGQLSRKPRSRRPKRPSTSI